MAPAMVAAQPMAMAGHRPARARSPRNTTPTIVGTTEIRQLLGYALADTDDEYEIRRVGLSALRWGTHTSWPVAKLLAALSGDPNSSIAAWREEFAGAALPLLEHPRQASR